VAGVLFAVDGIAVVAVFLARGLDTPPESMPPLLQVTPTHGVLHLVLGVLLSLAGFVRPDQAVRTLRVLGAAYLLLAVAGTFTPLDFGLGLEFEENALHWVVGLVMAVVGFWPEPGSQPRPA
jgi:hypothetical protein